MKKVIYLSAILIAMLAFLCGCQNTDTTGAKKDAKVYGLNEEVTVKTNDSEYLLKITGIKETSERNEYSDVEPAKVFIIDYEYQNVKGDGLYISEMDFKIIDEEKEIGGTYPLSCTYPQEVTEGVKCKAQMVLYVNNPSSKITLQYYDNMFNDNPDVIFELSL